MLCKHVILDSKFTCIIPRVANLCGVVANPRDRPRVLTTAVRIAHVLDEYNSIVSSLHNRSSIPNDVQQSVWQFNQLAKTDEEKTHG
jgi:hypothetical protein